MIIILITPLLSTTNFYLIRSIGWALRNAKRINQNKINDFVKTNNVSQKLIIVMNEH